MRVTDRERARERDCPVRALILHRKTLWHTQICFKRSHLTPFSDTLFALRLYYLSSLWNTLELYSSLKGQELAKIQNIYSANCSKSEQDIWAICPDMIRNSKYIFTMLRQLQQELRLFWKTLTFLTMCGERPVVNRVKKKLLYFQYFWGIKMLCIINQIIYEQIPL